MAATFQVLASGSSGNASLLDVAGRGVLIDLGVGPRLLGQRHGQGNAFWSHVHAAVLTHTHGDHWNENSLGNLVKRRLPLYCHEGHVETLAHNSARFGELEALGLVKRYAVDTQFEIAPGCQCEPFAVSHDGGVTCGFRFEGEAWSVAYAADLGSWTPSLTQRLANADIVALEFNHDVVMQYSSGRSLQLIRRVLGDHGHLSNVQAADLFARILRESAPGRPRHLVQLHLSRHCNTPELASSAAHQVVLESGFEVEIHTVVQGKVGPCLMLETAQAPVKAVPVHLPLLFSDWE